jgi:hypothetical protein
MSQQGGSGWRNWGDHPVVVIVSLIVGLIAIYAFVTGNTSLRGSAGPAPTDIPPAPSPAVTSTPAGTAEPTQAPSPRPTEPPTVAPTDPPPTETPEPPTPTAEPGTVLYEADWSNGMNGWAGANDWKTVSGMMVTDGTGPWQGTGIRAPFEPGEIADYAVEAEIQFVRIGGGADCDPFFGLFGRAEDFPEAGYMAGYILPTSCNNPGLGVYERNNRQPLESGPLSPDTEWHTYRVEFQGNVVRLYVDGGLHVEVTDNKYLTGGQVGLWNRSVEMNVRSFKVIKL